MGTPLMPNSQRRPVSQRLGMYFVGVALGLVLVGVLLSARRLMVRPEPAEPAPPAQAEPSP